MLINLRPRQFLKQSLQKNKLSQSYLFCGPKGTGKFDVAIEFACNVNKLKNSYKIIKKNINPDINIIKPEIKREGNNNISFHQIKESIRKISYYPYQEKRKFLIIKDADKMTLTASNGLLKTIEEPSADTIIVLISSNEELIIPTIKSRCQKIYFNLASKSSIKKELLKMNLQNNKEMLEKAVKFSWGRYKVAKNLFKDPILLREKEKEFNRFKDALKGGINDGLKLSDNIAKESEAILENIEEWIWHLRLFLLESIKNNQKKQIIKKVTILISDLLTIRDKIKTSNVNKKLLLENFFVQMN